MASRVRIRNKERLRRILKNLPGAQRGQIALALRQGANGIVATAKSLVPIDEGETLRSIKAQSGVENRDGYLLRKGRARTQDPELTMVISAGNPVTGNTTRSDAHLIEFGTSSMPRRPFFFPAFRAHRKEVTAMVRRAVKQAIKDALLGRGVVVR